MNLYLIKKNSVFNIFKLKNDVDSLTESGYSKNDIGSLNKEPKNILLEQNDDYLYFIKNEEKSIIEKLLGK